MRAVQVAEKGSVRIAEVDKPSPDDLAVVRMQTVGICGTDSAIVSGKIAASLPVTLGHEGVGIVSRAQPGGRHDVGQRVLIDPAVSCDRCRLCLQGYPNLCRNGGLLGRDFDGLFADFAAVDDKQLLPVPAEVSSSDVGLLQVLGTCIHAVRQARVFPGDVAVVIGLGVAGQLIAQLLSGQGLSVIGVTRSQHKRDLALQHGVSVAVAPDDAAAAVEQATNGWGADLVVEAVGTEATLAQSIHLAGHAGTVIMYGTAANGGQGLPYYELYFKELTILNPRAAIRADYQRAIDLVAAGSIKAAPLVTATFDLGHADQALVIVGEPSSLKVLLTAD